MCFLQKLLLGRTKGILLSCKEVLEELYLFYYFSFLFLFLFSGGIVFFIATNWEQTK